MSGATTSSRLSGPVLTPILLPIDINSASQFALFQTQRVLCGWKHQAEAVQKMFDTMRGGNRCLLWICVDVDDLVACFPSIAASVRAVKEQAVDTGTSREDVVLVMSEDANAVLDVRSSSSPSSSGLSRESETARDGQQQASNELLLPFLEAPKAVQTRNSINDKNHEQSTAAMRNKGAKLCVPVGHVSLDYTDFDGPPSPLLGSGDGRIVALSTLFILHAFRKFGLATSSVRHAEDILRADSLPGMILSTLGSVKAHTSADDTEKIEDVYSTKLKCEIMSLSMLGERHYLLDGPDGKGMWKRTGLPDVAVGRDGVKRNYLGPWYASMGFEKREELPKYRDFARDENGQEMEEAYWWAEVWTKSLT